MEELAKKLGKAKSSISKWESGERSPKIYEIEEIAEFFGVEPNVMMFGSNNVKSTSTTKQILDSVFSKLEEPRQDKVVAYAKSELDDQKKVMEIADYQTEKEYPYYDDAVSAGTGQYIGISQRETITLPVEFDASKRAKEQLLKLGLVDETEAVGVSKMLSAAAMTYVASFISSLLNLLRLVIMLSGRDD